RQQVLPVALAVRFERLDVIRPRHEPELAGWVSGGPGQLLTVAIRDGSVGQPMNEEDRSGYLAYPMDRIGQPRISAGNGRLEAENQRRERKGGQVTPNRQVVLEIRVEVREGAVRDDRLGVSSMTGGQQRRGCSHREAEQSDVLRGTSQAVHVG